jgi:hypothetical protein
MATKKSDDDGDKPAKKLTKAQAEEALAAGEIGWRDYLSAAQDDDNE